eukprot:1083979-Pyramimonas_sp.AAC.1
MILDIGYALGLRALAPTSPTRCNSDRTLDFPSGSTTINLDRITVHARRPPDRMAHVMADTNAAQPAKGVACKRAPRFVAPRNPNR